MFGLKIPPSLNMSLIANIPPRQGEAVLLAVETAVVAAGVLSLAVADLVGNHPLK